MADASPPEGFAAQLIRRDAEARSWREKLAAVQEILADESHELSPGDLADVAIYLRFLGTGEIPCQEDGRHFRPSHHARTATLIHARLAAVESDANAFLVRKIQTSLPSTAEPFQRAEPLTRIRDIAHRNDIPHDLKREIKTTLQNKLHRCAGPEDLVTSARLLERITAPGTGYSPDFVAQFRIFHGELLEFFNASSLDDRLRGIHPGNEAAEAIARFLAQKHDPAAALPLITRLRSLLRDRADDPEIRLADIALEDFAFVLLSDILNAEPDWDRSFELLDLSLSNLALSRIEPEETAATLAEINACRSGFSPADRDSLLRLKAAVDRARRLAGDFSDTVLANFTARAEALGTALGVPPHAATVLAEAEIRSHLVFQLAKLASHLLRRLRESLAQPPWDVLVSGTATGQLVSAATLETTNTNNGKIIARIDRATGEEEIPTHVAAILLGHDLPHLSHLGVRARQAGVLLATCEEPALFDNLRQYEGAWISIHATADGIEVTPGVETDSPVQATTPSAIPEVDLHPTAAILSVESIRASTGGNKSDGARLLLELAALPGSGFTALPGLVVPFGVMEQAMQAAPTQDRAQIAALPVPDEVSATVISTFGPDRLLAVRSSANSEDLADMSGAGLHESITGVPAREVGPAVAAVWASLWTDRAAASRRQAGIPHDAAHMAVLIQPLAEPELSFILHTVHPVSHDPGECYIELAPGLGETLASAGTRGSPYRLTCHKESGEITLLAFANFSHALTPTGPPQRVDYSQQPFTTDAALRTSLGQRLTRIAAFLEEKLGAPQDVEGLIRGDEIILVQSRAQQGLTPKG